MTAGQCGRVLAVLALLGAVLAGEPTALAGQGRGRSVAPPAPLPPIDRQVVRDQDDMTWDDYRPIPGAKWSDSLRASERTIRVAMVLADFDDHPFVITLPKHSDPFGNPQIDPVPRADIARFYHDFWNKPQAINHWRSVHEYWMELSRGRIGVEFTPFGPYRIPGRYDANNARLDSIWRAAEGDSIRKGFDLVMRIYAGYDETTLWQEFGEMKFQTRDDVTPDFCNPDPQAEPRCWSGTRYVDWTSWLAARYLWSNSAITMGESSGSIRHEIAHAAFRIGDNNNNPYVQPYRRAGAGPWDVMDRGSFNGPGGPHRRFLIPVTGGGAAPAGLLLRQRMMFGFVDENEVLVLSREGLARSGLAVGRVTARAVEPLPGELTGIVVRLDGAAPQDRTPPEDPATNPLAQGVQTYNNYTLEVVQRIGYDSFLPSHGVLITKNKDQPSQAGGPNSYVVFNWVIDANPQDIQVPDFRRPNGEVVMRTIADYRQLNDATFHAGVNSGSQYEWVDVHNRLHFYVVDVHHSPNGILSYTLGVRSLDGSGPQTRGVALVAPTAPPTGPDGRMEFTLTNTGTRVATSPELHPTDAMRHLDSDIYRLSVAVQGEGWAAELRNVLAAVPAGESRRLPVHVREVPGAADSAIVTLRAASESDPGKTAVVTWVVRRAQQRGEIPIVIETELGRIEAVLDSAHAPITVSNFLRYVDAGLFDDAQFFRAVRLDNQPNDSIRIEVVQVMRARSGVADFPPIPLERTSVTGLRHVDGALSMARNGPDTGTSSFSIVINEQPQMDFGGKRQPDGQGFAVFGRVTSGMDIARQIQARPTDGQRIVAPVRIQRIARR